ncbi:hypothetical protein KIH27_16460 [Mycobacterium sp. M1]|uniref:Uncharacterized protein n=1 Tax=Mycolicibacter acidiphilus TaxID=2835306 RepID=A0ABS5RLS6_9MYCO|nr:hypothetical protein [Mycolicibacter acidiphilus]MBS9535181.1 hypothetical protein [Mycolicibacter acidiphilus]
MGEELRVTVAGLRVLSRCCTDQADRLAVSPAAPVATAAWQSSGTTASTLTGRGTKVTATLKARLTANATKFALAASGYETQDDHSAAKLSQSDFTSAGGDGGAGGLPTLSSVPSATPVLR